jgi:hypothetical protein
MPRPLQAVADNQPGAGWCRRGRKSPVNAAAPRHTYSKRIGPSAGNTGLHRRHPAGDEAAPGGPATCQQIVAGVGERLVAGENRVRRVR